MDIKRIKRMIQREENSLAILPKNLSVHGHWDKGYHQGRLSVLESIYEQEVKDTKKRDIKIEER